MMIVMIKTLGMTMADKWCNEQSFVHQSGTIANMSCTLCTLCTQSHFKITLVLIVAPVMQKYKRNWWIFCPSFKLINLVQGSVFQKSSPPLQWTSQPRWTVILQKLIFHSGAFLVHVLYCGRYYESLWNIVKIKAEFSSSGVACWTVAENCRDFHLTLSTSVREGGQHRAVLEDKSGVEGRGGPPAEDKGKCCRQGSLLIIGKALEECQIFGNCQEIANCPWEICGDFYDPRGISGQPGK